MADPRYEDDEDFQDASDDIESPDAMSLQCSIDEAKQAMDYFMNNQIEEARTLIGPWANSSMYHALSHGTFQFLEAVLTFEPQHIEAAAEALDKSVEICNKLRKKSSSLGKMIKRTNYDHFTEVEIHAELCYAECLLLRAALTFIEDENFMSFVKGGFRIRACINAYTECWKILKNKNWESCQTKSHFESGVRMGVGAYNLIMSMLPARAMKLLEFIGFSGNREVGLKQLQMGSELHGSLRQILCAMILLVFNMNTLFAIGCEDGDLELAESIIKEQFSVFPKGVWYNFYMGRLKLVNGQINHAIDWYTKAWHSQNVWVQFHHICYWELMWAYCFKQDWNTAKDFSDRLSTESRWSKATYGYQKAAFLSMMRDQLNGDQLKELTQLFTDIPTWKKKISGKSLPMEKFALKKCERYFAQGNKLVLPALELMYIWNGFRILGKMPDLLKSMSQLVDKATSELEKEKGNNFYSDNRCLLFLLSGMCHKHIGNSGQAEKLFTDAIHLEKQLTVDHYLIPFATYELGIIYLQRKEMKLANSVLETAKNDYKGYALESRLAVKIHFALTEIQNLKKGDSAKMSPTMDNNSNHEQI